MSSGDAQKRAQFSELTGADDATAAAVLAQAQGDLDRALAIHYEEGADEDMKPADQPARPKKPSLPTEQSNEEIVGTILNQARNDGDDKPKEWGGEGRTLGSTAAADDDAAAAAAADSASAAAAASAEPPPPAYGDRRNAKRIRVIFWADGFTVEDVTAEEAAAEAAAKAPAAPRRTGLATLGSEQERTPAAPMPKLPELRPYEDNKEFMSDLKQSIPPKEFREFDLSTGVPQPRPVDIMLGDMRPQAYPKELVQRANAMAAMSANKEAQGKKKPAIMAFSGEGRTLGGSSASASDASGGGGEGSGAASTPAGGGEAGAWPNASRPAPVVDESAAVTEVQVRLPGLPPQRYRLNKTHAVADLKQVIEAALATNGVEPRSYVLMCGFPPKPLTDDGATVEAAGLVGAAVTHRWA
jgi:hypothetical protein